MVQKPTINPTGPARGGVEPVRFEPRVSTDLRQTIRPNFVGQESVVRLANQASQTALTAAKEFSRQNVIAQKMEAERLDSELLVAVTQATQAVRENVEDVSQIPEATIKAYDETASAFLNDKNLTSIQKRFLNERLAQRRAQFARGALEYQYEVEVAETQHNAKQAIEARKMALMQDPGQLQTSLEDANSFIDELEGMPIDQREELKRNARNQLSVSAAMGAIGKDANKGLEAIKSGVYDEYLSADQKASLINAAEAERSRLAKLEEDVAKKERERQANGLIQNYANQTLTAQDILMADVSPATKRTMFTMMESQENPFGNKRVYNELAAEIRDRQLSGETVTAEEIIQRADPNSPLLNDAPMNREEVSRLIELAEKPTNAAVERFKKMARSRIVELENPLTGASDPAGEELYYRFEIELEELIDKKVEQGISVYDLLNPNSGQYIGGIIQQFQRSAAEIESNRQRQIQIEAGGFAERRGENPEERKSLDELFKVGG